jgi:hypothetical protein
MSSRHTRRKQAAKKQLDKTIAIVQAHRAWEISQIVRANMSAPIERNYYGPGSMANLESQSHRGYVCRNRLSRVK